MGFVINDAMMIHTYELKKIARDRLFFFLPIGESIWFDARGTWSFFQDSTGLRPLLGPLPKKRHMLNSGPFRSSYSPTMHHIGTSGKRLKSFYT